MFTGNRLWPVFEQPVVQTRVLPLARRGIRVDRQTVLVKLLQCRHPLARAASALVAGLSLAIALAAFQYLASA